MTDDPIVSYFRRRNESINRASLYLGVCWILLNAVTALAFRFWVVDHFHLPIIEHKLWPSLFVVEGLVQLVAVVTAYIGLSRLRPSRKFWLFSAATTFCALVYLFIVVAWALALLGEYHLLQAFALYGRYLLIPAILFALYAWLVTPKRAISVWIYALCLTVALKTAVLIAPAKATFAVISYGLIIALALGSSVVVWLRLGKTNWEVTSAPSADVL
jgi:hypothetical protein